MFGDGCFIVAEIAQAHDGSLGTAHAYIDSAARSGADAVKFQTHLAEHESTKAEPWRVRFSPQDETRFDYWRRMEFTPEQWSGLKDHAHDVGLAFVSSPFSVQAVELLDRIGVDALKVASGEMSNIPLLEAMAGTGRPVILSSGMSPWEEIDRAVEIISEANNEFAVLQCTSEYPCPPESVGLNVITEIRDRYACPVGLSDHSGTIYAGLAAATIGIDVLEIHLTLSREMFGPDVPASVTAAELATLVNGIRFIERAQENPIDKDSLATRMDPLRRTFMKSIVAARDLKEGQVLTEADLAVKKPGTGLQPALLPIIVGRTIDRPYIRDEQIVFDDLGVS